MADQPHSTTDPMALDRPLGAEVGARSGQDRFDLTGQVALVTGGQPGAGRAMALGLAEAGADVIVASRKLDACEAVAAEVEALGRRALAVPANVSRWDELDHLVDSAYDAFGRVDVLVNNAGMSLLYGDLSEVTEAMWDKVVGLNLKGPFRLTALVGTRMVAAGGGSIINVSSTGSIRPGPVHASLRRGQGGSQRADRRFRPRLRADGPGQLHHGRALLHRCGRSTGTWRPSRPRPGPATRSQRGGQPDEIVGAALYFASDASSYTTGRRPPGGRGNPLSRLVSRSAGAVPGTVTVSVSRPERSTAPGVAPVSSPARTISPR